MSNSGHQLAVADSGFPVGGVDSRGSYLLKILYVETKESGPLGRASVTPPRYANGLLHPSESVRPNGQKIHYKSTFDKRNQRNRNLF